MPNVADKEQILCAIRKCADQLGHAPSRSEFKKHTDIRDYQVLKHFISWPSAVEAAGLNPRQQCKRIEDEELLQDWASIVRRHRHLPTRNLYRREGKFSPGSFETHFGPWANIPNKFREYAQGKSEWTDVMALLPVCLPKIKKTQTQSTSLESTEKDISLGNLSKSRHSKLQDRPTYGNPIDFRGLRHEPVNEQGVVFLFGMVARELGYMVEAVQTGFPDCEAKRQVEGGRWQRVRIEFEFESRNYDHPLDGCDIIVCWRHNWPECPENIEVIELQEVIKYLGKSDE